MRQSSRGALFFFAEVFSFLAAGFAAGQTISGQSDSGQTSSRKEPERVARNGGVGVSGNTNVRIVETEAELERKSSASEWIVLTPQSGGLGIRFKAPGTRQEAAVRSVNEMLNWQLVDKHRIELLLTDPMLGEISAALARFSEQRAAYQRDRYYEALLPMHHEYLASWFITHAFDETRPPLKTPQTPDVACRVWILCKPASHNPSADVALLETKRVIIAPAPNPGLAKEIKSTMCLPAICIDESKTFKTHVSAFNIRGATEFTEDARHNLLENHNVAYIAKLMTGNSEEMKQLNSARLKAVRKFASDRASKVPSLDMLKSTAVRILQNERDAEKWASFVQNRILKGFCASVRKLLEGDSTALGTLEEQFGVITALEENSDNSLRDYLRREVFPWMTFFVIDAGSTYLVDGTTAIDLYQAIIDRVSIKTPINQHRQEMNALAEELNNLKPQFPQPPLPPKPRQPDHPKFQNLNRVPISRSDYNALEEFLEKASKALSQSNIEGLKNMMDYAKVLAAYGLYESAKASAEYVSNAVEDLAELKKLAVAVERRLSEIEKIIEPTPEQWAAHELELDEYRSELAEWQGIVDEIIAKWTARNDNVQSHWQSHKTAATEFVKQKVPMYANLNAAIRTQSDAALQSEAEQNALKPVLIPSIDYFLDEVSLPAFYQRPSRQ